MLGDQTQRIHGRGDLTKPFQQPLKGKLTPSKNADRAKPSTSHMDKRRQPRRDFLKTSRDNELIGKGLPRNKSASTLMQGAATRRRNKDLNAMLAKERKEKHAQQGEEDSMQTDNSVTESSRQSLQVKPE